MRIIAIALIVSGTASALAHPTRWSVDEWRADLDYLHEHIKTVHANPYHTRSEEELDAAFAALHDELPELSDAAIAVRMQGILASLGDGHSHIRFWEQDLGRYFPMELWWFDEGIVITESSHEEVRGKRVRAINGMELEDIHRRVAPYISRDNDMGLIALLPAMLRHGTLLHAAHVTASIDRAVFTLVDEDGEVADFAMSAVPRSEFLEWQESLREASGRPLYRRDTATAYWYEVLPEDGAVYMQFNEVQHREDKDLDQFSEELMATMEDSGLECLIIDIRHNGGGNGMILGSLVRRIENSERLNRPGHLYLITGRHTFSAALILTLRLERRTHVLIAGEAGRGKPNSYSETGAFELPNTGLTGSVSALFRQDSSPHDHRGMVPPDIPAVLTYDDYREGRDPVLEAVLQHWREVRGE